MGSTTLLQVLMPRPSAQGALGQRQGSVAAPPIPLASYFTIEYFLVVDLQVLICVFAFLSPAAEMPRTSASGDDAAVEQTVPSTTVDPSSGIGATHSASSSDVNKTVDAGKLAVIAKPARKFGIKGFALIRAPA